MLLAVIAGVSARPAVAQQPASPTVVRGEAQRLEPGKPVERGLKAGETHRYTVALTNGQFLDAVVHQRGIDVVVRISGPDGAKLAEVDSPNGDQGDEPIELEAKAAGTYRIEVSSLEKDASPGRYEIRINAVLSPEAYASRLAEALRKQRAVISWLKTNAIPLKTVEAGNGFADLQPLKKILKDVRFVGLGEATHGTREFFQVKHRLLEFLVREMGFRVFALEGSYSALQLINDYVMGRMNDGTKALDSQGFWTWNTEEVRAMMDWARTYNAGVSADKRVKFTGFDIQYNQPGKDKLLAYLKRVAPERVAASEFLFKTNLDSLNSGLSTPGQQKESRSKLTELQISYKDLLAFLESNRASLSEKSSQADYEQMREYARVITQYIDAYGQATAGAGSALRDRYMADNFRRLVDQEPAGTRIVIWAHNGHITTERTETYVPIGAYLNQFYGKDYYVLGFSFNKGSFQAREAQPKDPANRLLMPFTVNPAPVESVDWHLAETGIKSFIVDFRSTPTNADIKRWLTTPHPMRSIGSIYTPVSDPNFFYPTTIGKEYDGLLFINTTTRARPNPSVKNVAGRDGK
jgi:erythromycin esterase